MVRRLPSACRRSTRFPASFRVLRGAFLLFLGFFTFLSATRAAETSDLAFVKSRGKLILLSYPLLDGTFVGVDVEAMRKEKLQLKDLRDPAAFRGIDIEILKGFAQSLGVKLEVHPVTSGYDAFLALLKGEGDLIASSYSITEQRKESADFSDPYITGWIAVAVPLDSSISTLTDLRGKRVAVMHGSSQFERAQALDLDLKIQLTDFALQNYVAVTEGKADFTLFDSYAPIGSPVSPAYPSLKVALRLSEFNYAVAARKGSDLLAPLNAYLAEIRKSGELERILGRYQPEEATPRPPAP